MQTERKFVIDIGTNSIRLLEAECGREGIRTVSKKLNTVRIGEGVNKTRRLNPAAMERGVAAVRQFAREASGRGEIFAFATSAVRDAINRQEFLSWIEVETGIRAEVLSGTEEAACGAWGALAGRDGATIDIGGGSTEIAIMRGGNLIFAESIDIGCVRAFELFPGEEEESLRRWALDAFYRVNFPGVEDVYAIGGTATALAAAELGLAVYDPAAVQGYVLTNKAAQALSGRLAVMSVAERMEKMCMDERRAEVVVYGLAILLAFMDCFSVSRITVSEADNLEGYLLQKIGKEYKLYQ